MAGDYSRNTFDPAKHYTRVLKQQGRVDVDADWNENDDLFLHRVVDETRDVIGPVGAPKNGGGFAVGKTAAGDDLTLSPGHFYVDGILCEMDGETAAVTTTAGQTSFAMPFLILDGRKLERNQWVVITTGNKSQTAKVTNVDPATASVTIADALANGGDSLVRRATTYLTQPDFDAPPLANGAYLVYLDVWEREISALDDPEIREIALGGPDTARRTKTVAQVRLLQSDQAVTCEQSAARLAAANPSSSGRLAARTAPLIGDTDPCHLPPTAGYLGMENQLYRVEIQSGGAVPGGAQPAPTFKWASDNASLEVGIKSINGRDIEVTEIGKDDLFRFFDAQWVEIVDEASLLAGGANELRKIATVKGDLRIITLQSDPPITTGKNLKLRGWKQQANADENGVAITSNAFAPLEYGIEVAFANGLYHTGDYWLIPARTAEQDILWPRYDENTPEHCPPRGIAHHYAPLALIQIVEGKVEDKISDCRTLFCPLTEACEEVDFDFYKKMLFGYGVACGLQLVCDGPRKKSVTVKKGYAIDCEGRDMVLTRNTSVDLTALPEWARVIESKAKQASVFITLAKNGGIDFHVKPYEQEGWLEGTPLMQAYEECQQRLIDYLTTNFARGNPDDPKVTDPEKRLITAWNLLVQLYNPVSAKHIYVSSEEHDILAEVYGEIRKLLRISNTYCGLDALTEFPKYPLNYEQATFFGKGEHTRLRVAPDPRLSFVFGGDDHINVFDGPALRFIHVFPDIGGARVLDVAFGRDPKFMHVLAESAGKSFIATCDFRIKDDAKAWQPPKPIDADERIVQLANGIDGVDVYGLGEQKHIYIVDPASGTAKGVTEDVFYEGFFIVDAATHRCFAANRDDTGTKGKYNRILEYNIVGNGTSFRRTNTYVLGATGSEGIAYSRSNKDLLAAIIDKEAKTGLKGVVTFDGPQTKNQIPLNTNSALRIAGVVNDIPLAAVAVAEANVVEFVRFERRLELTLPVQICPSDLTANSNNELVILNHRSYTLNLTRKPATPFPIPVLEKYRVAVLNAFRDLFIQMIESIKDCFCEHLMPDCPVCTKADVVYLGVLDLDANFAVRRICPLEKRTWLLSPRNVSYWLSIVPVLPAIRRFFEQLCCIDVPEVLKDKFKVPPESDDGYTCETLPKFEQFTLDRLRNPLDKFTTELRKKAPYLADLFFRNDAPAQPKPAVGGAKMAMQSRIATVDLIGQPIAAAKAQLLDAGIPIISVEQASGDAGLLDVLRPSADLTSGRAVTIVERDGKVANVHDRASTRDIGAVTEKVAQGQSANADKVDLGSLRDDLAALRAHVDESRKIIDERDKTIRSLSDNVDKLQGQLTEVRKQQEVSGARIDDLASKAKPVDAKKAAAARTARKAPKK